MHTRKKRVVKEKKSKQYGQFSLLTEGDVYSGAESNKQVISALYVLPTADTVNELILEQQRKKESTSEAAARIRKSQRRTIATDDPIKVDRKNLQQRIDILERTRQSRIDFLESVRHDTRFAAISDEMRSRIRDFDDLLRSLRQRQQSHSMSGPQTEASGGLVSYAEYEAMVHHYNTKLMDPSLGASSASSSSSTSPFAGMTQPKKRPTHKNTKTIEKHRIVPINEQLLAEIGRNDQASGMLERTSGAADLCPRCRMPLALVQESASLVCNNNDCSGYSAPYFAATSSLMPYGEEITYKPPPKEWIKTCTRYLSFTRPNAYTATASDIIAIRLALDNYHVHSVQIVTVNNIEEAMRRHGHQDLRSQCRRIAADLCGEPVPLLNDDVNAWLVHAYNQLQSDFTNNKHLFKPLFAHKQLVRDNLVEKSDVMNRLLCAIGMYAEAKCFVRRHSGIMQAENDHFLKQIFLRNLRIFQVDRRAVGFSKPITERDICAIFETPPLPKQLFTYRTIVV